jgi:hypothetical protein
MDQFLTNSIGFAKTFVVTLPQNLSGPDPVSQRPPALLVQLARQSRVKTVDPLQVRHQKTGKACTKLGRLVT